MSPHVESSDGPTGASDGPSKLLSTILGRSRRLGLLGPGPVEEQLRHALAFVPLVEGARRVLDLGSGGGLPGLVIADRLPSLELTLVDASERRVAFLRDGLRELGRPHARAVVGRAEELARDGSYREQYDVVVARSFGRPAVTAECGVGFLTPGGRMLVSEPESDSAARWPEAGVHQLDLVVGPLHRADGATIQELRRLGGSIETFPRRVGVPSRRPLF